MLQHVDNDYLSISVCNIYSRIRAIKGEGLRQYNLFLYQQSVNEWMKHLTHQAATVGYLDLKNTCQDDQWCLTRRSSPNIVSRLQRISHNKRACAYLLKISYRPLHRSWVWVWLECEWTPLCSEIDYKRIYETSNNLQDRFISDYITLPCSYPSHPPAFCMFSRAMLSWILT